MTNQELTLEQLKPISGGSIAKWIKKSIQDIVIVEFPRPGDSEPNDNDGWLFIQTKGSLKIFSIGN